MVLIVHNATVCASSRYLYSHAEKDLLHLVLEHQLLVPVLLHLAPQHLVFALQRLLLFLQNHHPAKKQQQKRKSEDQPSKQGRIDGHNPNRVTPPLSIVLNVVLNIVLNIVLFAEGTKPATVRWSSVYAQIVRRRR